jgi:hypothetical protein
MSTNSSRTVYKFIKVEVTDLAGFLAVHKMAEEAHQALGLSEALYQSTENPNEPTLILAGAEDHVQSWLNGADRIRLASEVEFVGESSSWDTTEMFPMGTYE